MAEDGLTAEIKEMVHADKKGEHEYSLPARILRWFIIRLFKIVEGIIRLFGAIYYGIKTAAVLLFRFFVWPYPIFFRRHK
mgnify:CR=1 FL=1